LRGHQAPICRTCECGNRCLRSTRPGRALSAPDYSIDIAPYALEVAPRRTIKTIAYNAQVPGPLLRFKECEPVTIQVTNHTTNNEIVHWHGLFLSPAVDGAMEEGTPHISSGNIASYTFTPRPRRVPLVPRPHLRR
jgi:FtsP/CotA-like multicopper oxidase with cupredoxin domain